MLLMFPVGAQAVHVLLFFSPSAAEPLIPAQAFGSARQPAPAGPGPGPGRSSRGRAAGRTGPAGDEPGFFRPGRSPGAAGQAGPGCTSTLRACRPAPGSGEFRRQAAREAAQRLRGFKFPPSGGRAPPTLCDTQAVLTPRPRGHGRRRASLTRSLSHGPGCPRRACQCVQSSQLVGPARVVPGPGRATAAGNDRQI